MKKEFYFPSADKKTRIRCAEWIPDGEVKAVVQICHGMCEYIDRYDDFASYTAFKSLTETLSIPITYVSENDTYDLLGLNMKVISAWDDFVDTFENNLCNRGSMMFKLSGNEDSFLFCADVEEPMEARIIEKHRDELQADYVQLAHHGNWGLSDAFYEIVSPKAAFFDAPASIIDVTDASFDGWKLRDSLTQKGIKLYRFADAPNSITIH